MANSTLTADIIAKAAVGILDNELVMANKVYRGYESDFSNSVNGYEAGDTVTIRRPADFTVRSGSTASIQDVIEGSTTMSVDTVKGVDFRFTSQQLTLDIKDLSERVIKPAMIQLANEIDSDLHSMFKYVPNWAGTPGQTINSFADFYKGVERLNEFGVPRDMMYSTLSPADEAGILGSQTSLYMQDVAKDAYRKGLVGSIGGVPTYMSQNVPTMTCGTRVGSIKVDQSFTSATQSWSDVKSSDTQTLHIDGLTNATDTVAAGEVFTIAGVYAVNPVTKARLPFLKQFVVTTAATAASNEVDLTISPAIVWSGAQKNVDVVGVSDLNNQDVTFLGTASTSYRQNMIFHRDAFAMVMVPMVSPPGAPQVGRSTYKGTRVRVIPTYDGTNDVSSWRLDVLYGKKAVDPRKATRLSGTA